MKKLLVTACLIAVGLTGADPASAQARFGAQVNLADDFDFGVGVRAVVPLGSAFGASEDEPLGRLKGVASFDYYFWDCPGVDCSYFEINGNLLYPLMVEGFDPYLGGGLNIARASVETSVGDVSDTEVGLNLLAGAEFDLGDLGAFAEIKGELAGGEQLVLTFGILFGGGG